MLRNKSRGSVVALFIRHPIPGRVKTRLAHDMGDENACGLYQAMVNDILSNIKASKLPVLLFHDGLDAIGLPQNWIDASCEVIPQQGGTIGEKMSAAFVQLFAANIRQVIMIGSDIPGLDSKLLRAASKALGKFDAAIAPAVDGGYCLIALDENSYRSRIFQDIEWSTGRVLHSTLERFEECGLPVKLLESRQDIDTCDDLKAYCRNPSEMAHATNEWLSVAGYLPARSSVVTGICQSYEPRSSNVRGVDTAQRHQGL
jgi:rSAM/selenodomain-associated transferase 1